MKWFSSLKYMIMDKTNYSNEKFPKIGRAMLTTTTTTTTVTKPYEVYEQKWNSNLYGVNVLKSVCMYNLEMKYECGALKMNEAGSEYFLFYFAIPRIFHSKIF